MPDMHRAGDRRTAWMIAPFCPGLLANVIALFEPSSASERWRLTPWPELKELDAGRFSDAMSVICQLDFFQVSNQVGFG
jgi:hypothetical protein